MLPDEELEALRAHARRVAKATGDLAHDFKNVLTIIVACTEELLELAPDEMRPALLETREAVRRATALTRDLTALGRVDVRDATDEAPPSRVQGRDSKPVSRTGGT